MHEGQICLLLSIYGFTTISKLPILVFSAILFPLFA